MRIWSLHPQYLDANSLASLWQETLLAQTVLLGNSAAYTHHPQLIRFHQSGNPVGAIASYLRAIADEADQRGYQFDRSKIARKRFNRRIRVTLGQVGYEFDHLKSQLRTRAPFLYARLNAANSIRLHPLFTSVEGDVEEWEMFSLCS